MGLTPFPYYPRRVVFGRRNVPPPADLYITPDESLLLESWNTLAQQRLTVRGRILTPLGEINHFQLHLTCNTFGNRQAARELLPEGFLLSLTVHATEENTDTSGTTFVQVSLMRGDLAAAQVMQVLCRGYIHGYAVLSWPGGTMEDPWRGVNGIQTVNLGGVIAGIEYGGGIGGNQLCRVIAWSFTLVTDATAGNRHVRGRTTYGSSLLFAAPVEQAPSTTRAYRFFRGPVHSGLVQTTIYASLPDDLVLHHGHLIETATVNLAAGDQFSAGAVLFEVLSPCF